MHKLARQIVERRNLVFLFVILAAIFTVFSVRWVKVETDMTTYLPKTSETRMGLDIMDEQFTTYALPMSWWPTSRPLRPMSFPTGSPSSRRPDAGLRRHDRPL